MHLACEDSISLVVTETVESESIAGRNSKYVHTDEIDGYTPIAAIYHRGNTDATVAPSGINYEPGTRPYTRLINTTSSTRTVSGSVTFVFISNAVLGM